MHSRKISVTGLGYVGLPLAVAFAQNQQVVGFDRNPQRIAELKQGIDRTEEISTEQLRNAKLVLTSDPSSLKAANFHIVAVPTPIDNARRPDLSLLLSASKTIGQQLKKGDIVVYESTVYPGATEEDCVPILEQYSGLKAGIDFKVGYSPERINPGDKQHTITKITKVVSGQDEESLNIIADVYGSIITAGIYRATSIKVAEAAKVIENTQRDVNIALMNELALIFNAMNIKTQDVLAAAGTKWNFIPFTPGLVGGHCIGVDPYYLAFKAQQLGLHPEVILSGRRINDNMGTYIADQTILKILAAGEYVQGANIAVLGLTFKENCPDIRNSKVVDIIQRLKQYKTNVYIHAPRANPEEVKHEFGLTVSSWESIPQVSAIIIAVAHDLFLDTHHYNLASKLTERGIVIDIKGITGRISNYALCERTWSL